MTRYGISVPNFGPWADPRTLVALARDAEAAGWDGVFLWDNVYSEGFPVADAYVALAAIAAATERVALGPMITPLPRRRPVKVARETVSLDLLSGGRLIFGAGIGAGVEEFRDMGEETDPKARGDMLDEALDLIAAIWSGEPVDHAGPDKRYQVRVESPPGSGTIMGFGPQPLQSPRIPVWVAATGRNKRPLRRAARWDGLFFVPADERSMTTGAMPDELAWAVEYARANRPSDATGEWDVASAGLTPGDDRDAAREQIEALREAAGLTWWVENVNPWAFGWDGTGDWPLAAMTGRVRQGPPR